MARTRNTGLAGFGSAIVIARKRHRAFWDCARVLNAVLGCVDVDILQLLFDQVAPPRYTGPKKTPCPPPPWEPGELEYLKTHYSLDADPGKPGHSALHEYVSWAGAMDKRLRTA
jgi:hypothetical protein